EHDEELRTLRMTRRGSGHCNDPATIVRRHRVVVDGVAGAAGAVPFRIPALDHEARHETVKGDALIEPAACQCDEVSCRARAKRSLDLDGDGALGRLHR